MMMDDQNHYMCMLAASQRYHYLEYIFGQLDLQTFVEVNCKTAYFQMFHTIFSNRFIRKFIQHLQCWSIQPIKPILHVVASP